MADYLYLDNNATTMPAPEVVEAVRLAENLANPASQHAAGREAEDAIEAARICIADSTGSRPSQVTFTSGATESINLALLGAWRAHAREGIPRVRHRVAVGATEHPAVLESVYALALEGATLVELPVMTDGLVDLEMASQLIDDSVFMVSVMAANNETGVIGQMVELARLAHVAGAYMHTDATQAMGRIPVDMAAWDVDLMSISAHKFHGPRGVGALIHDRAVPLEPLVYGGGQERGLRPGTHNTPGIVGLGRAARLVPHLLTQAGPTARLRDLLFDLIRAEIPDVSRNGSEDLVLPNTLNLTIPGADNEAVLSGLVSVMCSTGSACASGKPEPSHVLLRMGLSKTQANESLRFSLSYMTTENQIRSAACEIVESVKYVRRIMGRGVSR